MEIRIQEHGDIVVLSLLGKLNVSSVSKLDVQINTLVNQGRKKIVLNCEDLDYISSAGIRIFLSAAKKMEANEGKFIICCVGEDVFRVIKLTGFDQVLNIYDSELEGFSHF